MSPNDETETARSAHEDPISEKVATSWSTPDWARVKTISAILVVASLFGAYGLASWTGALTDIMDSETLRNHVENLGVLGPFGIVALMSAAIVLNPIPSAPIALASGAAFGHFWGTIYVVIGAESGALIAFGIARFVGYDVLRKWFGQHVSLGALGSQNALMAAVFLSRLLPFISFDLVSYGAGLTPLKWWRFAVATLAGIIPASFLLAHFGGELASFDSERVMYTVVALGVVTGVPIAGKVIWNYCRKKADRKNVSL